MIYLDNNATTRIDPLVRQAMLPWLDEQFGNPSAGYRFGRTAKRAIDEAREKVAALIDAHPEEIIFTSGGTESNNTAIHSAILTRPGKQAILTSTVEHSAIEKVARFYESTGYRHRPNPVDSSGALDLDQWAENLADDDCAIASLIWANNETGVISPVEKAAELAAERKVFFHTDAVQAVGKIPLSVKEDRFQALSISAHKLHGPKGIGALYTNRHSRFNPLLHGGGQENERRSGTENVASIVGFGVAAELAVARLRNHTSHRLKKLRDQFEQRIIALINGTEINGDRDNRLPNTSNLFFPGIDGEGLLILLDEAEICCSPGSACSTGSVQPSRIVRAMGHSKTRARSSVRFSFSHENTEEEIHSAVDSIKTAVGKLRVTMPSGGGVIRSSRS